MKYFEVQSGKPTGEVYHREILVALTEESAISQVEAWRAAIEAGEAPASGKWESENWLYGPGYHEREGDPADCLTWDGFGEVPAEVLHNGREAGNSKGAGLGVTCQLVVRYSPVIRAVATLRFGVWARRARPAKGGCMNAKQAKNLLLYTVVMRNGDPNFKGTVVEVGYGGFIVRWENGTGERFDFQNAKHVDEWQPAEKGQEEA